MEKALSFPFFEGQLIDREAKVKEQVGQIVGLLSLPWLLYLLWDAWRSESILVKGRGDELGGFARRVYRADAPASYWFSFGFYALIFGFFLVVCGGNLLK